MAHLKFGIFDTIIGADPSENIAALYAAHIEDARIAESLGYDYFFIIEHQNAFFPCVSSPTAYLGALAQATSRIRFGPMIFQVPLHNPMRLAQDAATIDHLSQGRFEFGIGYGNVRDEYLPFGLDFMKRRDMGREAMEIVIKTWTESPMSHEGTFWTYQNALPQPAPYQKPYPPCWMGAHSDASFDYAATMNFNVGQIFEVESHMIEKFAFFRELWKGKGHAGPMPHQLLMRHIHVAETDEQARAEAEPHLLEGGLIGKDSKRRSVELAKIGTPEMNEISRILKASTESYDFWIDEGLAFVGSPETVSRMVAEQSQKAGYDVLIGMHNIGKMPHALARRSMELFGQAVIPAFAQTAVPA